MQIRVQSETNKQGVYKVIRYFYRRSDRAWIRILALVMSFGVGVLALLIRSYTIGAVLMLYGVLLVVLPSFYAWIMTRRYFSNPKLGGTHEYEITDDCLKSRCGVGESTIQWDMFTKWAESPDAFLLIIYKGHFVFAMKAGFANQADIDEFRSFLVSRMGKPAF